MYKTLAYHIILVCSRIDKVLRMLNKRSMEYDTRSREMDWL